jgi:hypothetical protein
MRTAIPMAVVAAALACSLPSVPAHARARTFVASYGNDSNPCTFLSPCKTFQQAVNIVDSDGEVTAIDSAGFGPITINKSVSITSPEGVEAGVLVPPGGTGITINAGINDKVDLRGLVVQGAGIGSYGMLFQSGASLTIENCVVRNLGAGIAFIPNATSNLAISNTFTADNSFDGILIQPNGSGRVKAVINRVEAQNNGVNGIAVDGSGSTGPINVTVTDSVASNNGTGIIAYSTNGAASFLLKVVRSVSANNTLGVSANGAGIVLAQSTVSENQAGWSETNFGVFYSFGDNYIVSNSDGDIAPNHVLASK